MTVELLAGTDRLRGHRTPFVPATVGRGSTAVDPVGGMSVAAVPASRARQHRDRTGCPGYAA